MTGPLGEAAGFSALGMEIVGGSPDEDELAALVAVGLAARAAAQRSIAEPVRAVGAEWVARGRRSAMHRPATRLAGASSDDWRWSLHP